MTNEDMTEIIKHELINQGINQRILSQITGFTEASISSWLTNKRDMKFKTASTMLNKLGLEIKIIRKEG